MTALPTDPPTAQSADHAQTDAAPAAPLDRAALTDLLQRGYRYALSLTHDQAVAEDLLHDAWISLLRAGAAQTRSYLFRAVRTRFIDRYRRQRLVVMTALDEGGAEHAVADGDLANAVIAGDLLEHALGNLRAEEREAVYLAMVEGHTSEEIANLTGRSAGAVRTLLSRVRSKLRHSLTRVDAEEAAR